MILQKFDTRKIVSYLATTTLGFLSELEEQFCFYALWSMYDLRVLEVLSFTCLQSLAAFFKLTESAPIGFAAIQLLSILYCR